MRHVTFLICLLIALSPMANAAFDPPHGSNCQDCHTPHVQATGALDTFTGNANLCLSCHNPTGQASALPLSHADRADLLEETGNSHAWQVGAVNTSAGAVTPETTAVLERLHEGHIVCSTCHDQHNQTFPPFLRASNSGDALCLDCHRLRNLGEWESNPSENIGSHPIGVAVPADDTHRIPGDGDFNLPLQSGNVSCTTCHAVHFAPSTQTVQLHASAGTMESASVAGDPLVADAHTGWEVVFVSPGTNERERRFIESNSSNMLSWVEPLPAAVQAGNLFFIQQPGLGDGNLLRAPNSEDLCKTCHTLPDHPHESALVSCRGCHTPHGTDNILLVAPEIADTAVTFDGLTSADFIHGEPDFDGICEVCHTQTSYHRNNPTGDHSHNVGSVCTDCHTHENGFEAEIGDCSTCHEATTTTLVTGSHPSHFTAAFGPGISDCATCHGANADTGGHAGHRNGVVNFTDGATINLTATAVCNTCHSPAGFYDGVAEAKSVWTGGVYASPGNLDASHSLWCAGCHDDDPVTGGVDESSLIGAVHAKSTLGNNATYGHYVTGHGRSGNTHAAMSWQAPSDTGNPAAGLNCDTCHDAASAHIDGAAGSSNRLRAGFAVDQSNAGCTICHSPAGLANHAPDYFTSSGDYEASVHGNQLCTACHDPHGAAGPNAAMAVAFEETMCLDCHQGVEAEFGLSSHHDVSDSEQAVNGSRIECTMCHNPHLATESQPLVSPDSVTSKWTNSSPRDFCLACHDGAPPSAVDFPSSSSGSGWDQSDFVGSHHDTELAGDCTLCHSGHGSNNRSTLHSNYSIGNYTNPSEAAYQACFDCHDVNATIYQRNAFNEYHQKHVAEEDAPCIACHNPHRSYDAAEDGLIDFEFSSTHGYLTFTSGRDLSTSFVDTGTNRGSCYIRCHGEGHSPESYTGITVTTVP